MAVEDCGGGMSECSRECPVDGACALGFRCMEFTSSNMTDAQFTSLICSHLNIELADRGRRQEENVTYYR